MGFPLFCTFWVIEKHLGWGIYFEMQCLHRLCVVHHIIVNVLYSQNLTYVSYL